MEKIIHEMKEYAIAENVPIIMDEGIEVIINIIKDNNIKTILEIGSAIGYSATMMQTSNDCLITTIERDEKMYHKAVEFISKLNLEYKIKLIFDDALTIDNKNFEMYDMLYIDAAKSQYKNFFEKYKDHVKENGIIIFDNLDFHGMVHMKQEEIKNRNTRQLMRKLGAFNDYIRSLEDYEFEYIGGGDGLGIARKKI